MKNASFALGLLLLASPGFANAQEKVFDAHVHLWEYEASLQEYLEGVEAAGAQVDRIGALQGGNHMARHGQPAETRARNDELVALAGKHPKLMPVATVHPYDGEAAVEELERLAALGVGAIKLHPHSQRFAPDDPRVLALCRRAGELGFVVLMDNANIVGGDSQALFNLALGAPDTHFVFNHIGGMDFRFWNILALARTAEGLMADNFHFDIAATVLLAADSPVEDEFVWTLRNVGIEHILIGSDFPQMSLGDTLAALEKLDLTDEEKRRIRWQNAERIFGAAAE